MHLSFKNDINLIKSLKRGDSEAYNFLINVYHQRLCVYAFDLTKDFNLSEDIVQNVFLNVWKQRHKLKNDFVIKSYLYKSVHNEFIDQYRKKKSVLELEKKYFDALSIITDDEDNSLDKLILLVKNNIEKLPPKCKKTFLLSKQEGLTNIEISEYLNISIKSVEGHITKAFKILREVIGDKMDSVLFLLFGTHVRL